MSTLGAQSLQYLCGERYLSFGRLPENHSLRSWGSLFKVLFLASLVCSINLCVFQLANTIVLIIFAL